MKNYNVPNTKAELEIIEGFNNDKVLIIKEQTPYSPLLGDAEYCEKTRQENTIYGASIIYEF